MSLNNLAMLYKSEGKYSEAERLYRRALSIFERSLGPDHPHVEACRANLAGLLSEMGRESNEDG